MKRTSISIEYMWFRTYVTDALGHMNDCYVRYAPDDALIGLLTAPTWRYECYEEVE